MSTALSRKYDLDLSMRVILQHGRSVGGERRISRLSLMFSRVRRPPRSGSLSEWGRLKGGRPILGFLLSREAAICAIRPGTGRNLNGEAPRPCFRARPAKVDPPPICACLVRVPALGGRIARTKGLLLVLWRRALPLFFLKLDRWRAILLSISADSVLRKQRDSKICMIPQSVGASLSEMRGHKGGQNSLRQLPEFGIG